MAGLAAVRHLLRELSAMDILVTRRALQRSFPMELARALCVHLLTGVACHARNGGVRTQQSKACILMVIDRIAHAKEIAIRVARFALSAVGTFGKLSRVRIGMAIGTALKFRDMKPEFPAGVPPLVVVLMTIVAFQQRVFSFQRKFRGVMIELSFSDLVKIIRRMTRCALLFEFSLVRVFVA